MTKHTPGPWTVHAVYRTITEAAEGRMIVELAGFPVTPYRSELEANAHLIEAAPDYDGAATLFIQYEEAMARGDDVAAMALYAETSKQLRAAKDKATRAAAPMAADALCDFRAEGRT